MSREVMQQLVDALEEFGVHYEHCPQYPTFARPELEPPCNCGYEKALAAGRRELKKHADEPVAEGLLKITMQIKNYEVSRLVSLDVIKTSSAPEVERHSWQAWLDLKAASAIKEKNT